MGETIKEYEGSNGHTHKIILGEDGVVYCDCPAWKFSGRKTCKHVVRFFNEAKNSIMGFVPVPRPIKEYAGTFPIAFDDNSDLEKNIAEAVALIKGG